MALRGKLRDFNITQLLNLINLARKTGALTIERSGKEVKIYFREGKLVYAFLNGQDEGLTGMLRKAGKISAEQSRVIRTRSETNSDKELGLLLMNAGFVAQDDIVQSVRSHTLDAVYSVFSWTDGSFHFEPNELPTEGTITVPINLENIIMEGSRRVKEHQMLQDELPDLDVALRLTERPYPSARDVKLTADEWRVVSLISRRNTLRQMANTNSMSDFQIRKIVYGLLSAGLVKLALPQEEKRVPALPREEKKVPAPPDEVSPPPPWKRGLILRLIERIRRI